MSRACRRVASRTRQAAAESAGSMPPAGAGAPSTSGACTFALNTNFCWGPRLPARTRKHGARNGCTRTHAHGARRTALVEGWQWGYHARYLVTALEASLLRTPSSSFLPLLVRGELHGVFTCRGLCSFTIFGPPGRRKVCGAAERRCDERGVWGVWGGRERAVCGGYGKVGRERGK